MSWFPIPEWLLYENPVWRKMTTAERVMLLCCISEHNLRGRPFYRSHDDWCVRLGAGLESNCKHQERGKSHRRHDEKLACLAMNYETFKSMHRNFLSRAGAVLTVKRGMWNRASEYTSTLANAGELKGHWCQMPRYMFEQILYLLGPAAALAYVYLTAEYHRYRRRYEDRGKFYVSLGEMQRESGLDHFYYIVQCLYQGWVWSDKSHLFEVSGCTKLIFTKWQIGNENGNAAGWYQRERDIQAAAHIFSRIRKQPKTKQLKAVKA